MKRKFSFFYVLLLVYLLIWVILKTGESIWISLGVNMVVLHGAHLVLWLVTIFTSQLVARSFSNPNPQVSVRALMGSLLIKFMVLALAAFVYIIAQRKQVNIPALIGGAFLYIVYTVLETRWLLKQLKKTSNG